tara:strand:- start:1115 stop:1330 length:216 start_codon:yes stop_codon:yes gene_type:complete
MAEEPFSNKSIALEVVFNPKRHVAIETGSIDSEETLNSLLVNERKGIAAVTPVIILIKSFLFKVIKFNPLI